MVKGEKMPVHRNPLPGGWRLGAGDSRQEIDGLIEYIKRQEEHHGRTTFVEEYRKLLEEAGIEFAERYML